ncbi:hypothetical protein TWF506_004082 [Arthrobotrys conoides]|uniref:F-box domain-containing protein n=1 Tax=Arthrobotrys conoides TaxID=74498 RepID=A0AAN8NKS4_9PEZI
MATLSILPVELQIQILSFVHPWDYPAVLQVCSLWRSIIASRDIQDFRNPIIRAGDTDHRIHWLLYSRFYCNSHCLICKSKYESHKSLYPTLSAATAKRIFLTVKLHPLNTELTSYELWIENCTFSPSAAEVSSGDFRKINIPIVHTLLDEKVLSYERLPQGDPSPNYYPAIQEQMKDPFLSQYNNSRWIRMFRDMVPGAASSGPNAPSEAIHIVQLGQLLTIPPGMPRFHLQYDACFPHCTNRIVDKDTPTANLTAPIHPALTVRQLLDLLLVRLRKICYKNPARNIERALRVRFFVDGTSEDGFPIMKLGLDAEGVCCQEVENLTLGGGVWASVFSRVKAQDAGIRYWEM